MAKTLDNLSNHCNKSSNTVATTSGNTVATTSNNTAATTTGNSVAITSNDTVTLTVNTHCYSSSRMYMLNEVRILRRSFSCCIFLSLNFPSINLFTRTISV